MEMIFANTRDQAFLAMVIQEASKVAKQEDTYVGRTALQKVMYFLKALNVPINYRFDIYRYGPFCQEILDDVNILIVEAVIKDKSSSRRKYSNYAPDINTNELITNFTDIETHRKKVKSIVNAFIPLKPKELELLSTLDYLYRWFKASGAKMPFKEKVVDRFLMVI